MPVVINASTIRDARKYQREWAEARERAVVRDSLRLADYVVGVLWSMRAELLRERDAARARALPPKPPETPREPCGDCGRPLMEKDKRRRAWGDTPSTTYKRCASCYARYWEAR